MGELSEYDAGSGKKNTRLDVLQELGHLAAFIDCQDGNRLYGLDKIGYLKKQGSAQAGI